VWPAPYQQIRSSHLAAGVRVPKAQRGQSRGAAGRPERERERHDAQVGQHRRGQRRPPACRAPTWLGQRRQKPRSNPHRRDRLWQEAHTGGPERKQAAAPLRRQQCLRVLEVLGAFKECITAAVREQASGVQHAAAIVL